MLSLRLAVAFLYVLLAGNSFLVARPIDNLVQAQATSEPPGPGCPSIPGGPGPLPDDDDDDEVQSSG
jgi:hypothetical protein